MDIRDTEEYKTHNFSIVTCPICGNETLDSHYICPHCNWEYDGTVEDDEYSSANGDTVKEYKIKFGKEKYEIYHWRNQPKRRI